MLQRVHRWLPLRLSIPLVVIGAWGLILPPDEPKAFMDLAAVIIAGYAWFESRRSANASLRSADLADANEERSKYGWSVTLHPNGDHYVLRNVGTLTAHDVKLGKPGPGDSGPFHEGRFLVRDAPDSGPTIKPGQAKAFQLIATFGDPNIELVIDWQPDGERDRQSFNEAVPPMSNRAFDEHVKERKERTAAEELERERELSEARRLLADLAGAWGDYQDNPSTRNKIRVQGLVGGLPTNFVKLIGYAVDVPRDYWGPHQYPLEDFVQEPQDKEIVRRDAPMIELIWNLWQIQLRPLGEADLSQAPRYWHRIEHAVWGYLELVHNREAGTPELIDGPRDRKQRQEADQMFKLAGLKGPDQQPDTQPSSE